MTLWKANAPDGLNRDQDAIFLLDQRGASKPTRYLNSLQRKGKLVSMQNNILSFTAVRPDFVLTAPSCPTCRSGMRFVKAAPTAFARCLVDVSYICGECGREAKRTIKSTSN